MVISLTKRCDSSNSLSMFASFASLFSLKKLIHQTCNLNLHVEPNDGREFPTSVVTSLNLSIPIVAIVIRAVGQVILAALLQDRFGRARLQSPQVQEGLRKLVVRKHPPSVDAVGVRMEPHPNGYVVRLVVAKIHHDRKKIRELLVVQVIESVPIDVNPSVSEVSRLPDGVVSSLDPEIVPTKSFHSQHLQPSWLNGVNVSLHQVHVRVSVEVLFRQVKEVVPRPTVVIVSLKLNSPEMDTAKTLPDSLTELLQYL